MSGKQGADLLAMQQKGQAAIRKQRADARANQYGRVFPVRACKAGDFLSHLGPEGSECGCLWKLVYWHNHSRTLCCIDNAKCELRWTEDHKPVMSHADEADYHSQSSQEDLMGIFKRPGQPGGKQHWVGLQRYEMAGADDLDSPSICKAYRIHPKLIAEMFKLDRLEL